MNTLKMATGLIVVAFAIAAIPTTNAQSTTTFAYGSLVGHLDGDSTASLTALAERDICFIDDNGDQSYDPGEPIYLNVDLAGCGENVEANDIRLTAAGSHAAGTLVRTTDNDFGDPLDADRAAQGDVDFQDLAAFRHFDADGNGFFNTGDTLYFDLDGDGTVEIGDLRLTPYGSHAAGSIVAAGNPDLNLNLAAATFVNTEFAFWDLNGDGNFNGNDIFYMDQDDDGFAEVNDVRLTPFGSMGYGSLVGADDGDATPQLTMFGAARETCFIDDNGDGTYDPGEPIYLDVNEADCDGNTEANDVRLTPNASGAAGTLVRTTDNDFGDPITDDRATTIDNDFVDLAAYRHFDADGNGFFNTGDTLYLDLDADGVVEIGDLRMTAYGSHAAGTVVAAGNPDLNLNLAAATFVDTEWGFWDLNGDGAFNGNDVLVLNQDGDAEAPDFAEVNDIRVTGGVFGSLIKAGDRDATPQLTALAERDICFIDDNGDQAYDPGEPIYLNVDLAGCGENVEANDIRLTTASGKAPGTLVRTTDEDFGDPLDADRAAQGDTDFQDLAAFRHFDADGNGFFNTGDTLYFDLDGDGTVEIGDLRMTAYGSHAAGTTVAAGNPDLNLNLAAATFVNTEFAFWDLNGDGNFNGEDGFYLDQDDDGFAEVNDLRLSSLTAGTTTPPTQPTTPTTPTTPTDVPTVPTTPTEPTAPTTPTTPTTPTNPTQPTTPTGDDSDDDDDDGGEEEPTPGFGLVAVLAAFGLIAVAIRRRL